MYCKFIFLLTLSLVNGSSVCNKWNRGRSYSSKLRIDVACSTHECCYSECSSRSFSFGTEWRLDVPECYCLYRTGFSATGSANYDFYLHCGISFLHNQVKIGSTSIVKFSYEMKSEPAETSIEVFAIDGLDDATQSDRFLIRDPRLNLHYSKLDLYRSNLTKRYIGFHHNKIPASTFVAETYRLYYKMGDMDLENETLWCTIITANHQLLKFSFTPIVVQPTIKNSNMMMDITQNLNGTEFTISYSMQIDGNPTADIRDILICLHPVSNLEFQNFNTSNEESLEFTEVSIWEKFQLFKLSRLSIETRLDFYITYQLKNDKILAGKQILPVVHEFRYTTFTDGIPLAQLNNFTVEENTTKMHNPDSIVYPSRSVHYDDTTVVEGKSGELALCVAKKYRYSTCLVYNIDTSEVRLLPHGLTKVVGYNNQTDSFSFYNCYSKIVSYSVLEGPLITNDHKRHVAENVFKVATFISESNNFEDSSSKCQVRVDGLIDIATKEYRILF